ncbi:LINE-1 reverse transcriptase-like [Vitis vinifera]|uniref:LINE-1 reverse transcriptase-like n=1 Tax=Vitis vinifera TaxID=29760 RepID=A0A438KRH1_VITVI|nr:LINE-1 reverse transcriptase-like [Vitis vinifera]
MVRGWGRQNGSFSEVGCCVQTEDNRGFGFGEYSWRNLALLGKWLWRYPREGLALWHQVILSIYGSHSNGWDANTLVRWSHRCPWKAIAQVFQGFSLITRCQIMAIIIFRVFSVKSFFLALSQSSGSPQNFPSKFVWNSQVPFKVKSFVWLVAHKKVNTNDMLQVRRPYKALSPDICFGNSKRGIVLWQATSIALIRVVWWERNARIFEDKVRNLEFLWDSIVFLASLWAFCSKAFKGIPLNVIQLDWIAKLRKPKRWGSTGRWLRHAIGEMEPKDGMFDGGRERERGLGENSWPSHFLMGLGYPEAPGSGESAGWAFRDGPLGKPRGPVGLNPSSSSVDSFGPKEMVDLRRTKVWKTSEGAGLVADGQSPRLSEAEILYKERSKTNLTFVEEALRYDSVSFQSGCLVSGPLSLSSSFYGQTPLGEYCDLFGDEKEHDEGENPLQILIGTEPPWGGAQLGESDLAKFSKFLGFSTEGLEKDIMDFLVKIRKRRERVHSKTLLEKSKFERELKRLECSINYEGGKKQNGGEQETKIQTLSEGLVRSLGSGRWSNWVALDALGSIGGMLVCWDKRPFSKKDRDCLWEELGAIRGLWEDPGCLGGDFNVILSQRERSRQGRLTGAMRSFAQTVDELELLDLSMQGGVSLGVGGIEVRERASFRLASKLKVLKQKIKVWSREVFGRLEVNKNSALQQLEYWDGVESERSLSIAETEQKKEAKDAFYKWVLIEEVHWRQKSRELWLKERDRNTGFFHRMANAHRRNNSLDRIMINGEWLTEDQEEAEDLEMPFSEEEIHFALMEMRGDKAPGPDGFTVAFWQACWDFVKEEVVDLFKEFYEHGSFAKCLNTTFLVLIPKKGVLANRLKKVLDRVVSVDQNAFVRGRQILDAPLVANEVIDYWHKRKEKGLICKLDIEKAYDSINWKFLMKVLRKMGFGSRWMDWMWWCISTAKFSILINGVPVGFFSNSKGLRQGDPLSPYLFVLGMEVLSTLLRWAARREQLTNLSWILAWFEAASSLRINLAKSVQIPVGEVDELEELAAELGCRLGALPTVYWGCPLEPTIKPLLPGMGPKDEGGLGIRKIDLLNKALLGKWVWRYVYEKDNLWKTVIGVKYGQEGCGWRTKEVCGSFGVGLWKEIMKEADWCWESIEFKVGKGTKVLFWTDKWCGNEALSQTFPQLFTLAGHRNAKELDQIGDMLNLLRDFRTSPEEDSVRWKGDDNASWGKILTLDKLQRRGWQLPNRCFLCGCEEENENHILLHCTVVKTLWEIALAIFGVQWVFPE